MSNPQFIKSDIIAEMSPKIFRFLKFIGIVAVLGYIAYLNFRLVNIEKRFGGAEKLKCSPDAVQKLMNERVVRIEGSLSEGSGFPINENQILTNFHVIDGDASPKVVFPDGSIETPSLIIGDRKKDIALLHVKRKLTPLSFYGYLGTADSSPNLSFGEPLFAAGYALGSELKGGVAINRGSFNETRHEDSVDLSYIMTDTTLIEGMSGGPLVNACGQVVGVNTQGVAGLSMFIDIASVQNSMGDFSQDEVAKIKVDTTTPEGVVNAFYTYIGARDLKKAYDLVDPMRQTQPFDSWTQGYSKTLQVSLISAIPDKTNKNKIMIKLSSLDWVDGTTQIKYFEGYWIVGENLKLKESQINTVKDPDFEWFYPPEESK